VGDCNRVPFGLCQPTGDGPRCCSRGLSVPAIFLSTIVARSTVVPAPPAGRFISFAVVRLPSSLQPRGRLHTFVNLSCGCLKRDILAAPVERVINSTIRPHFLAHVHLKDPTSLLFELHAPSSRSSSKTSTPAALNSSANFRRLPLTRIAHVYHHHHVSNAPTGWQEKPLSSSSFHCVKPNPTITPIVTSCVDQATAPIVSV